MSGPVKLYNYFRSSASWRVRIALNLKGIAFEYVPVSLVADGGEHLKDAYGTVNPLRAVPALEIDGHVLSESMAIIEYLEETHPTPPLLPKDPFLRAQTRRIAEVFNAGTQPLQNLRVLNRIEAQFKASTEDKKNWAGYFIAQSFDRLEQLLRTTAGKYCVGDAVTLADVGLVPQCFGARRFEVDLAPYPLIAAIEQRLVQLPAFVAAHPDKQPDSPVPEVLMPKTKRSAALQRAFEKEIKAAALAYPEAHEDHPWGETVYKVKGKVFVFLGVPSDHFGLSLKLPESHRAALMLPFCEPTGYGLGKSGWVSAKFEGTEEVPTPLLLEWLEESYRAVAPKKLVKLLDAKAQDK